jgi:hypothetical protein
MASAQGAATFSVVAKDAASSVLRGVGKEMGQLGKTGSAVFKTLAAAAAVVATAIATAGAAALKFTQKAIQAAIEDDAEQQKLIATLVARGLSTEEATKRTNELIEAGQKLAFTDSETRAGLGIASQFTKNYAKQTKILTAAQNVARARNISLEAATKLVGKAYSGSGKALKNYGVDLARTVHWTERKVKVDKDGNKQVTESNKSRNETIKGVEALALINQKFAGVAEAYSKTFEGQFKGVRIAIDETVESIGFAIGGGEGLPTFVRLLEGIRPVLDDVLGEINKNLPNIEKFSRELVEKFLAKLPGYVATAKRELPILIDKAKEFIGSVAGFAKDISTFLGPDGLITAGIAGVGLKMGGLAGGIGAVFAEQFIKMGVDPITASITGTIGGAITAGVVQGFGSAVAQAAIAKFLGLFKSIPISPSIPTAVPGAGIPGAAAAGAAGLGIAVSIVAITTAAAAALSNAITEKGLTNKVGGNNVIDIFGTTAATLKPSTDPMKDLKNFFEFIFTGKRSEVEASIKGGVSEGLAPVAAYLGRDITWQSNTTIKLDGQVLAEAVDKRLGISTGLTNGGRVNNRNR